MVFHLIFLLIVDRALRVRTSPPPGLRDAGERTALSHRTSQDVRHATAVLQLQHTQRQTTTVLRLQRLRRQGRALARQLPNECATCCLTDSSALTTTCTAMTSCTLPPHRQSNQRASSTSTAHSGPRSLAAARQSPRIPMPGGASSRATC